MSTYRVMDSDGVVVDRSWNTSDINDEEVIEWYKNMVTGMTSFTETRNVLGAGR